MLAQQLVRYMELGTDGSFPGGKLARLSTRLK